MFRIQCWGDPDILASFAVLSGLQFWASPVLCFFFSFLPSEFRFLLCSVLQLEWVSVWFGFGLGWAWVFISCTGAIKFVIWATSVHWTQHREQLRIFSSPVVLPHFFFFLLFFLFTIFRRKLLGLRSRRVARHCLQLVINSFAMFFAVFFSVLFLLFFEFRWFVRVVI